MLEVLAVLLVVLFAIPFSLMLWCKALNNLDDIIYLLRLRFGGKDTR